MNLRSLTALLASASIAGVVGNVLTQGSPVGTKGGRDASLVRAFGLVPDQLRADNPDPLVDSDGDLLPDQLEWVTLTDPRVSDTDQNGKDDFLQTVQHLSPGSTKNRPDQDEVRVLVSSVKVGNDADVYVHMLFRFLGNRVGNVQQMTPFITFGTAQPINVPIMELIGSGPVAVRTSYSQAHGTFIAISARISRASDLAPLLPATIGAEAIIDGKDYTSGTYLAQTDGLQVALVPIDAGFVAQPIVGGDGQNNPFWNANSVCVMKMTVVGSGLSGMLCEVDSAQCEVANGLRCAPSCRSSIGRLVFVPDGLSTLTGG